MGFRGLDPELARALIEGQTDVITPAAEMESEVYKHAKCPICGQVGADKTVSPAKVVMHEEDGMVVLSAPFSQSSPLIQGHAKCGQCQTEYSPETGVIIKQPEPVLTDPHFNYE